MSEPRWKSVPFGFGWQKIGDPSTDTADNMVEDYEEELERLRQKIQLLAADNMVEQYEAELERLRQENQRLRRVLKFDDA